MVSILFCNSMNHLVGIPPEVRQQRAHRRLLVQSFVGKPWPEMPPLSTFSPKHGLPKLGEYKKTLPASYWAKWQKRTLEQVLPVKSWVDPDRVMELARKWDYRDTERLERVYKRLKGGADIGCKGRGRLPTKARNGPSAYEYGDRVADAF